MTFKVPGEFMKKLSFLVAALLLLASPSHAIAADSAVVKSVSSFGGGMTQVRQSVTDDAGNVTTSVYFYKTMTAYGKSFTASNNGYESLVIQVDKANQILWARAYPSAANLAQGPNGE
ncbi:MAG: hypothetical protein ACKOWJ_03080, partial [Micrococcales bacterium]